MRDNKCIIKKMIYDNMRDVKEKKDYVCSRIKRKKETGREERLYKYNIEIIVYDVCVNYIQGA